MKYKKLIYYFIIALLVLYILVFDDASFLQKHQARKKMHQLQEQIEALRLENERLQLENEKLQVDELTLEKKARELGMRKEGEEIFRFKK